MHRISDPVHFRRSIGGLSLIIAPLLILAGTYIEPESGDESAAYLRALGENPEAAGVATVLWFLGFIVLTSAVVALIHLIRDRAVVLGHVGGVLAFAGSIALAALVVTGIYDIALGSVIPLQQGLAVDKAIGEDPASYWVFIPAILGTSIGLVLLTAALWRGGVLPVWVFPVLLMGFVVLLLGGEERIVAMVGGALLLVGLAYAGWTVLKMRDEEWVRPPAGSARPEQRGRGTGVGTTGAAARDDSGRESPDRSPTAR